MTKRRATSDGCLNVAVVERHPASAVQLRLTETGRSAPHPLPLYGRCRPKLAVAGVLRLPLKQSLSKPSTPSHRGTVGWLDPVTCLATQRSHRLSVHHRSSRVARLERDDGNLGPRPSRAPRHPFPETEQRRHASTRAFVLLPRERDADLSPRLVHHLERQQAVHHRPYR